MGKPMMPYDEFRSIFNALKNNPQGEKETQKAYYEKLTFDYNIKRSRATLQLIETAKKNTDDVEKAYSKYQELTRTRERNRRNRLKAVQMEMSSDYLKTHVSTPSVCPQEDQMEVEDGFQSEKETFEICDLVFEISIKVKRRTQK